MDQQSEHLSNAEIEQYGEQAPSPEPEADDRRDRVEAHLADCPACRGRVFSSQRARLALLTASSVTTAPNADRPGLGRRGPGGEDISRTRLEPGGPDCPDEDDLRHLAAGLSPPDQATRLTQHAAQCNHCGPLLRMFSEDFSDDLGSEDAALLGKLESSSGTWQKKLARKMLEQSGASRDSSARSGTRKIFPWRWVLTPTALAACAAIAFAVWYSQRETPEKVEKLLAQAYTENRQLEMRIPYAKHAEVRQQRGNGTETSYLQLPPSFRQATEIIASKLDHGSQDPRWLLLKARLDVLQGLYDSALESLDKLHEPSFPDYHLTRALALSQKADKESNPQLYAVAVNELSTELLQTPDDTVALFDRALVYEKMGMLDNADEDLKRFLSMEKDRGWREEGARRLNEIDIQLQREKRQRSFLDLRQINSLPEQEVNSHVEEYQDALLRSRTSQVLVRGDRDLERALTKLANLLAELHGDAWLQDFVKATSSDQLGAIRALREAVIENEAGRYRAALKSSRHAAALFRSSGNRPGEIRSRYEEVYADHRALKASACLARASPLLEKVRRSRYRWLQTQLGIETAICLNSKGELSKARELLATSRDIAQSYQFPVLLLRQIGITAGIDRLHGKCDEAWAESVRGLALYWQGTYPKVRRYQLYMVMGLCATDSKHWAIAEALERNAISLLDKDADPIQLAVARLTLVNLLLFQQKDGAAEEEMRDAQRLFESARQDQLNDIYRLTTTIDLAESQMEHGKPQLAIATLQLSERLLASTQGYFIALPFYRVRADAYLSLAQFDKAAHDYNSAIQHAENSLRSLRKESDRLRWIGETDRAYRGLVLVLLKTGEPEHALQVWEWYRGRSLDTIQFPAARPNRVPLAMKPVETLQLPGASDLRLTYAVFEDGFELWSLSKSGLNSYWVSVPRKKLESLAREFAKMCATESSSLEDLRLEDLRSRDLEVSDILLRPIYSQLNTANLITVDLDQSLANVAMEVLITPSGEYLGIKSSVTYSPGHIAERLLRQVHLLNGHSSVVIIRPVALASVAGYSSEQNAIVESFPNTKVISIGESALTGALQSLSRADSAHFVGHGRPDGSGTALVFSDGAHGLLRARDLQPRFLMHLQLVVLAACSTGVGGEDGLLDPQNLVHAFISSGVPNIVASRWNVDSESTARLMSSFYRHLGRGELAPEALSSARREFIAVKSHPYYWAGFSISGRSGGNN